MNGHTKINPAIPYLKGNFLLGKLGDFLELDGEGIIRLFDEAKSIMHDKNVNMCQFRIGWKKVYILADEDLIEVFKTKYEKFLDYDIPLLTKFLGNTISNVNHDLWAKEREILLHNIHGKNLQAISNTILCTAKKHINQAATKEQPEFKALFNGFALDVFTHNYIGLEHDEESINELVSFLYDLTGNVLQLRNAFKWSLPPIIRKMLLRKEESLEMQREKMQNRFLKLYESKKIPGAVPLYVKQVQQLVNEEKGRALTGIADSEINIKELAARLLYITSTSVLTTAATLQFAVLLISSHREVEKKLQDELSNHHIHFDTLTDLNAIDFKQFEYLDCIINEVFRLFPAIPFSVPRDTMQAFTLGDKQIKPGELVIAAPYILQNLERNYSEPTKFNPDRFLDRSLTRPKVFSMGPRTCPGKHLAMMEIKTMLTLLYSQYSVELDIPPITSSKDIALTLKEGAMSPKNRFYGKLIRRKN